MPRTIKFRAWVKSKDSMVDVIAIEQTPDEEYPHGWIACPWEQGFNESIDTQEKDCVFKTEDVVLMQYTGLKDKNGTPIFENDIVEHYGEVFEVVFDEGAFLINGISTRINPDGSEYTVRGDLLMNQDDVLVVIGNRWENPDLLPANKEG